MPCRRNPTRENCCAEPTNCVMASDNFNRGDSTNLGPDWDEESGDWEIVSHRLKCTTSPGVVRNLAVNTFGTRNQIVSATIWDFVDDTKYRLIAQCNEDGDTYYFAEWHYVDSSTMYFRIGSCTGGTETIHKTLGPDGPLGDGTGISFYVTERNQFCMQDLSSRITICLPPFEGMYTGLGSGTSNGATFDNFLFSAHEDDSYFCGSCDCSCEGFCVPKDLTATFENINECTYLDGLTLPLTNNNPIKFGEGWLQLTPVLCPSNPGGQDWLQLQMQCRTGGAVLDNFNLMFLLAPGSGDPVSVDTSVSTCEPLSLRFGPFNWGTVSDCFPTTCCGGTPCGTTPEDSSLFYIWITE